MYAGGSFTTVGGTTRNRLCKFDAAGTLTAFNPNINSGVNALALDGSNLYAGGDFTTVGGSTTRNRLCKFDAAGTLTAFNPNINSTVRALALDGSNLYVGGSFITVGGSTTRNYLCKFDAAGTLTAFDPNMSTPVIALALNGTKLYVGGGSLFINSVQLAIYADAGMVCNCDPTCSPIPTAAGTYDGAIAYTDAATGFTHYCDNSGKLLLSTKTVAAGSTTTISPAAVQVKIGATAATFYPKWCGGTTAADKCFMVKTPATGGNVLINRFWHIDAAQVTGTAVNATNQLQISTYFSDTEYTALQTQMSTNSVLPALTSQTGLVLYQPFASPALAKFADPSLVKPLTFTRIGNGASVGVNLWLHTTPTSGINAATFKVNSIVNSGGIGRY